MSLYFWFDQFLDARAEIRRMFSSLFGKLMTPNLYRVYYVSKKQNCQEIIKINLSHVCVRIYQIPNAPIWNFRTRPTVSYIICFTTAKNEQQLRNEKPVLLQIFCVIYFNHLWSHHVTIIILPNINSAQSCVLIWLCSILLVFNS